MFKIQLLLSDIHPTKIEQTDRCIEVLIATKQKTQKSEAPLFCYKSIFLLSRAFPVELVVKNLPADAEDTTDTGSTSGSGRVPGEENGNPFQCFCLGNPMDRGV